MVALNEGNPSELLSLAAEVQRGFDESGKLPERLKRYSLARDRAVINLAHVEQRLNALGVSPLPDIRFKKLDSVRTRLSICGNFLAFKHYYTVGKVRLSAANFCMVHLLCPLCAIRRGSKTLEAYLSKFEIIKSENPELRLSMLTLTVKNGDDLTERFNHLKKSLKSLLERRRKTLAGARGWHSEFAKIAGLVGSIEVTNKGQGWHPHAHIMVLHSERFDYVSLQAEWLKITGDSHVLNVAPAQNPKDPAKDFMEVFKYALKFTDLTPEQNLEAFEVMTGKNLLFSAGLFRGVDVPEDMTDTPLEDLPYIELFYNYLPGSGYNLTKTQDSEVFKIGSQAVNRSQVEYYVEAL